MKTIWLVITNSGDGSNGLCLVKEPKVLAHMQRLADDGDEQYSSGDGLQQTKLTFPDDFDVDKWVKDNFYDYTTMEDFE